MPIHVSAINALNEKIKSLTKTQTLYQNYPEQDQHDEETKAEFVILHKKVADSATSDIASIRGSIEILNKLSLEAQMP